MGENAFIAYIGKLIEEKGVIAIDGRCASGKTTLVNTLSTLYDVEVIHMDDFFLPKELRTEARLAECGGNVHYERFYEEVICNLRKQEGFTYRKFDCKRMGYTCSYTISNEKAIIIEGAYSLRPAFQAHYDLKVFKDIAKEEQAERIVRRNGLEQYEVFKKLWIPKEEAYFEKFNIKKLSDIIID